MNDPENTEQTAGGPLGKLAGRVKEAAGSALGKEDLAREGRLPQAQVDAEAAAAREAEEARQREAEAERVAAAQQAGRLQQEARRAESTADAIDPEEQ